MSSLLIAETVRGIPHQLRQNPKYDTGAVSRTTRVFGGDRTYYNYQENPVIKLELPASGTYDMQMSSIGFHLAYDAGELLSSVATLFRRILIRGADGKIWCETENIDELSVILQDCTSNYDRRDHAFSITSLTGDKNRRETAGRNGGVFVSFQPLLELCRYEKYLPMHLLGKCTVEIYTQDPRVCFRHTTDVAYKISNVTYRVDLVQFEQEVEASMESAWKADRLRFHFKNWRSTQYQSDAQNAIIKISNPDTSIDTLLISTRKASVTTAQNANSYERCFENLEEIDITAGTNKIERINCKNGAGQAFFNLQGALDFSETCMITPEEWVSNKFVTGQNLQVVTGNSDAIAGYSGRGDIQVVFYRSSLPSESLVYSCFCLHDQILLAGEQEGTRVLW